MKIATQVVAADAPCDLASIHPLFGRIVCSPRQGPSRRQRHDTVQHIGLLHLALASEQRNIQTGMFDHQIAHLVVECAVELVQVLPRRIQHGIVRGLVHRVLVASVAKGGGCRCVGLQCVRALCHFLCGRLVGHADEVIEAFHLGAWVDGHIEEMDLGALEVRQPLGEDLGIHRPRQPAAGLDHVAWQALAIVRGRASVLRPCGNDAADVHVKVGRALLDTVALALAVAALIACAGTVLRCEDSKVVVC
mmetsp:Transcript_9535/g.25948  ORF Transcript_9535/g.25948 Transcript_9535/m.25948 type:complete len:249 (+) Transcript_9535:308-1054(+)